MTEPLLRLERVSHGRLADVSLELRAGEVVGLVGVAGSGKSTLLKLAAGGLRPDTGEVWAGARRAAAPAARRTVGYAAATPCFPPGVTVRRLLEYYARFHASGPERRALLAAALEIGDLWSVADQRPAQLPLSWLRRVSLAQAVLGGRRVLLLDETLEGLDAPTRKRQTERLGRLAWEGAAIIVASHDLGGVERFADRIVVLRGGRVVRDTPAAVLLASRVLEVVLDAPPGAVPPGFRLAPFGVEADLGPTTVESALAVCRAHRLVVRGTRVRARSLEDVVVETGGGS